MFPKIYPEKTVQKLEQATTMNFTLALFIRIGKKPETTTDLAIWQQLGELC